MALNTESARSGEQRAFAPRIVVAGSGEFEGEMLYRALERSGFAVDVSADADAAVLALLAEPAEAVVISEEMRIDLRMTLIRWLRRTPGLSHLPVVVLCGHGNPEHAVGAYDAGADLVVFKPVDPDLLGRKLAAVIRRGPAAHPGA